MATETPETTMTPEDVPAELVDAAMARRGVGTVVWPHELRIILAAVLPAHRAMVLKSIACQPPGVAVLTEEDLAARDAEIEQRVRAKVAEEIMAHAQKLMDAAVEQVKDGGEAGFSALLRAAAIKSTAALARGERP